MAGQQGLDIWYDVSESFAPDDPGIFLGRGGTTNSIANIVHVQGGWVTVPKESDLEDIHIDRAFDGQIVYVSASHELYRVERFIPGFTPDYDLNALPSRSFHSFSWPNADTASHVDGLEFQLPSGTASFTDITASGAIMAAGHVSASSFILNGLSFSDSVITTFSGSTQFGAIASASVFDMDSGQFTPAEINHDFTGSLNVTGGLFVSGGLNVDGNSIATIINLNNSSSALQTNIDDKASIAQLNNSSSALQTNIDDKASIAQLNNSSSALQTNIDDKASIAQLNNSSSALQTNINLKAPIANPSFTGTASFVSHITASGNISASGTIEGASLDINGAADINGNLTGVHSLTAQGINATNNVTTPLIRLKDITLLNKTQETYLSLGTRDVSGDEAVLNLSNIGNITASGNISASGLLFASASLPTHTDSIVAVVYDTHSGQFHYTGSYGEGGVTQTTELEEFSFDSLIVSNINTPFEFVSSQFTASKDDTTLWPEGTGYVDINNSISSVIDNDSNTSCTFSTLVEDAFNFIFTFNEPVILSEIRTEFVKLGEGYALPEQVFLYGKNSPFESGESDGALLGEGARIGMGDFNNTVFTNPSSNPVSIFGVGDNRNLSRTSSIVETSLTSSFQYYRIRYKGSQLSGTERSDGFVSIKEVTPVTRSFTDKGTSISASNGVLNVNTLVTDNLIGTASNAELANTANSATSASYALTASFVDGASVNLTNITSDIIPSDNTISIGTSTNKFKEIFAIDTFFGGIHEINLETEGLNKMQEGTVLTLRNGMMCPCENEADPLVMGVVSKGENYPIVLGAEPILITGKIKEGDYIITSNIKGHGKGVNPQYIYNKRLFGKIIAQAIESGDGESYTIKAMIRKM